MTDSVINRLVSDVRVEGETLSLAINADVDLNNSPILRATLLELLEENKPKQLVFSLANVGYMDSSALAVLIEMFRKIGRSGKVVLTDLQPRVKGLLEIARLNSIFTIR